MHDIYAIFSMYANNLSMNIEQVKIIRVIFKRHNREYALWEW